MAPLTNSVSSHKNNLFILTSFLRRPSSFGKKVWITLSSIKSIMTEFCSVRMRQQEFAVESVQKITRPGQTQYRLGEMTTSPITLGGRVMSLNKLWTPLICPSFREANTILIIWLSPWMLRIPPTTSPNTISIHSSDICKEWPPVRSLPNTMAVKDLLCSRGALLQGLENM